VKKNMIAAAANATFQGVDKKPMMNKLLISLRLVMLAGFLPILLFTTLTACDKPVEVEPPVETSGMETKANETVPVVLTEEEAALIKIFEAAMIRESDLPDGFSWEEQQFMKANWYSVEFTSQGGSAEKIRVYAYLTTAFESDEMTAEEYFVYENEEMLANESYAFDGLPLAYIIMSDTSIYEEEETTAMLGFLKNGQYECGITVQGKDLDYKYCEEEAIRLGTLIWERLAE
jgi:hypothetical protein